MPKHKIKAVFFDLGGVIVNHTGDMVLSRIGTTFNVAPEKVIHSWRRHVHHLLKGHTSFSACLKQMARDCGLPPVLPEVISKIGALYQKLQKPNPGVMAIIRALRQHGYYLGLISNTFESHSKLFRRTVEKYFDVAVYSHRVGLIKPYRPIFYLALRKAGCKPREAIFIDDMSENIRAARKIGMYGILFRNAADLRKRLKRLGVL
jgi:putative hydrolase of the HAD superfamily